MEGGSQTPENGLSLVAEALPKSGKSELTMERLPEHELSPNGG